MEKIVIYKIDDSIINPIRKIISGISPTDMKGDHGLSDNDIIKVQEFLDFTFYDEGDD